MCKTMVDSGHHLVGIRFSQASVNTSAWCVRSSARASPIESFQELWHIGVDSPRFLDGSALGARGDALNSEGAPVKTNGVERDSATESQDSKKLPILASLRPLNGDLAAHALNMRHDELK